MKEFLKIYKKYAQKSMVFLSILFTIIVVTIRDVLTPYLGANILDSVINGAELEEIIKEAAIFLGVFALNSLVLAKIRNVVAWNLELNMEQKVCNKCFSTLLKQTMRFHNDNFSGSLVSYVTKFVGAVESFSDMVMWEILPGFTMLVTILIVLFIKIPIYSILVSIIIILFFIFVVVTNKKITKCNEVVSNAEHDIVGHLSDCVTNIAAVKSFAMEKPENQHFNSLTSRLRTVRIKELSAFFRRDIGLSLVVLSMYAAMLFSIIYGSVNQLITSGTIILIFTYTQSILGHLWDWGNIFRHLSRVLGNAEKMVKVLNSEIDIVDKSNEKLVVSNGEIEFKNVSFSYLDNKEHLLNDFSLIIPAGTTLGLAGPSGGGKSTITYLVQRFMDIDKGSICIDGQEIDKVTQKSLHKQIAYVPQETILFHRTIAENIAYSNPNVTREEIIQAAKLANADEFIVKTKDGYDTIVGERGVKLSGGQRQRIAIARAFLKNAPILILDEATSALDSDSERLIQEALKRLMKGRTCIVIAHRLSTIMQLDNIVVMDRGKITEQGTHEQLLKNKNTYFKLWTKQIGN